MISSIFRKIFDIDRFFDSRMFIPKPRPGKTGILKSRRFAKRRRNKLRFKRTA